MALIPPQPIGMLPGSGLWNDWIEKIRSVVNQTLTSINWGIITGTPTTVAGYGITNAATTTTTLDANHLILGNGSHDIIDLASLGTTTTVLHGNAAGAPTFGAVVLTTDVSGVLPSANGGNPGGANPSASVGLAAVNGTATTFLRSDGAPALSQAITPTWTNTHTFGNATLAWSANITGAQASASLISDQGNNLTTAELFLGGGSSRGSKVRDFRGASSNVHSLRFYTYNTGEVLAVELSAAGAMTVTGGITHGSTTLLTTSTALTDGSAAAAGTLLNAPAAGNPTKWAPVDDNGTVRYVPMW